MYQPTEVPVADSEMDWGTTNKFEAVWIESFDSYL